MTELLCQGFHRNTRPQPEPGLVYCQTCLNRLHHTLTDIALHRAILPAFAQPGSSTTSSEPTHTKRTPPAAGRLEVIAAMDPRTQRPTPDDEDRTWPVDAIINTWHQHWTAKLGSSTTHTDPLTQLHWQATHLNRIATWPDLTGYDADMRTTGRVLKHLTADAPPPPVGQCPETNPDTGQPCKGPMHFTGQGNRHVQCARCHTTWHTSELTTLIAYIQPGRPVPIPVAAVLQRHPHLSARTLRHWAATGRVRRYTHGHVDYTDVLLNLDTPTLHSA